MQLVRLSPFSQRSKWCPAAPVVASCLILLAALLPAHAAVPPLFATFLQENSAILSLGHDSSGNLYALGVAPTGPSLFVDASRPASDGNGSFPAIALNGDGTKNSVANPATGGSWVSIFFNGVGAYTGDTPPATGSITGPNPPPIGVLVSVDGLESGPVTAWPGLISGLYQVEVKMPASTQADGHRVYLTAVVDGVPAAPLSYLNQVYQGVGTVWVN